MTHCVMILHNGNYVQTSGSSIFERVAVKRQQTIFIVAKEGVANMGIVDILVTKVREQFGAVESTPDPYVKLPTLTQA